MSTRVAASSVKLKRADDKLARDDGVRVLIDRLWPRGVTKECAKVEQWISDLAPNTALRKWVGHDPARWQEFRERYAAQVRNHPSQIRELRVLARQGPIMLVYAAPDSAHNGAGMLRALVLGRKIPSRSTASASRN